jgi:DNA-binding SARP family transcriptional activator
LRAISATEGAASASNTAPATEDAKQAEAAKLKEADDLIAAGRADEATARLREAASLDPSDAEPHRRLARLLLEGGARRTAITELQTVTRLAPDDAAAWRDLANAQSAEGDYAAAADSYHALFGLSGEATADDRLQLAYADALRQSGRAREAQSLYKRLANSRVAEVARASRQQLGNLNSNESKNSNPNTNSNANESANAAVANSANNAARPAETPRPQESSNAAAQARPSPATLPADASPRDHYERGVQLWHTNRSAALTELGAASQGGNADADYYLGLNLAEGRDPRALRRGELLAALNYFQRARRSRFSGEARRYEDALVKEYDRRRTGNANEQR